MPQLGHRLRSFRFTFGLAPTGFAACQETGTPALEHALADRATLCGIPWNRVTAHRYLFAPKRSGTCPAATTDGAGPMTGGSAPERRPSTWSGRAARNGTEANSSAGKGRSCVDFRPEWHGRLPSASPHGRQPPSGGRRRPCRPGRVRQLCCARWVRSSRAGDSVSRTSPRMASPAFVAAAFTVAARAVPARAGMAPCDFVDHQRFWLTFRGGLTECEVSDGAGPAEQPRRTRSAPAVGHDLLDGTAQGRALPERRRGDTLWSGGR